MMMILYFIKLLLLLFNWRIMMCVATFRYPSLPPPPSSSQRSIGSFVPVFGCHHHHQGKMSSQKASSSDFTTTSASALEEQLKAVEGRNEAIQSYLNALEEEERELERLKAEMMTATRIRTHTNSGTTNAAVSSASSESKSNTTVIKQSSNNNNKEDGNHSNDNDNPITIPITNQNNNYSNSNRLVLGGGGIFVSMVGLRQFLHQRPVKQKELNDHDENLMMMTKMMSTPPNTYNKVIGIGTGGCNVVQLLYSKTKELDLFYECIQIKEAETSNKNVIQVESKDTLQTLLIGTQSDGNSSKREQIQYGVDTSKEQLTVLLKDAKFRVFALEASDLFSSIVSSVMVQQETNKTKKGLSICIASTAFPFEGDKRLRRSKKTIDNLTQIADMTVVIPSTIILDTVSKDTPIKTVYSMVDEILSLAVTGILHLTEDKTKDSSKRLLDSTNLNRLEKRFHNSNSLGSMGIGKGEGSNAAVDAVLSAIASPMLGEINIQVKSILCTIQGGPNSMTSKDVRACEETLLQCFGQDTEVFLSAFIDEARTNDVVSVVIIALDH